jgi:crotonobetainyl-CoA:carnitine CoA-transferase CaiB-like acyl-CoA transferase
MMPLANLQVLDFSTLLPGPMASLILAEAGATVVKIERPDHGDEMRSYHPKLGEDSVNFHLLNRGKQSYAIDLKSPAALEQLQPLIATADVLIEQFRPGVMQRLGLDYAAVSAVNPGIIYCSLTGWGQDGPKSQVAAHDLNYMAETGLLALSADRDGTPVLPPMLIADLAGGTLPAIVNILLALRQRDQTGLGSHLDIAMSDSLFTFAYWALGEGFSIGKWPRSGGELTTGGSARYQIYRTHDGKYLAAAPLEDRFWDNFCRIIELSEPMRRVDAPAEAVIAAVADLIGRRTASQWQNAFAGHDVCCSVVTDLRDAVADPQTVARKLFSSLLDAGGKMLPALPVPLAPVFRTKADCRAAPRLGEHQ